MTSWEEGQFSYVRATKAIRPNFQLEQFLARALSVAGDVFGWKGNTTKHEVVRSQAEPDLAVVYEISGIDVPSVKVWPADEVELILFERWAAPGDEVAQYYYRLSDRMSTTHLSGRKKFTRPHGPRVATRRENPIRKGLNDIQSTYFPSKSVPRVRFSAVVESNERAREAGRTYALVVDESPVARFLEAQAQYLEREVGKTAVGHLIASSNGHPQSGVEARFLYVPNDNQDLHNKYLSRVNAELPEGSHEIGPLVWDPHVVPAN